ncbi:heavy metal translocating P-type ATPase [Levilactobacillus parabrevis]|uniref:heavy metal translocating P-type ATPase n=1 Tax=Levilactobacillus parabrevis TaxID=357278 RepID=UPI0021A3149E|nr:heavy metal translocating P-type ATPase [Levilactobacillus parabrevis]MCT4486490.1 cadmium-translocating P-type ATPase [Levilactobacillus parabrevis]MCT4489885.1 cadmium-translocating P-type ATPase [Levilactobacillus parabrevis]
MREYLKLAETKRNLAMILGSMLLLVIASFSPLLKAVTIGLYLIAYLLVGGPILVDAVKDLFNGKLFGEAFLMTVATVGALAIQQYPEAVAVMLFYRIGEFFQDSAVSKSKQSITSLLKIRPDAANLVVNGHTQQITPDQIKVGDTLIVRPGEKVPADGTVTSGETYLDTKALTGETKPSLVVAGDQALSGTIVSNGVIELRVEKAYADSTVAKILELFQDATNKKTKTENFITKFARVYTPAVVGMAALLAIVPPLFFAQPFADWLYRALIFLVISCPCALVISVPLSYFGGIGAASRSGVLIKGSNYLEALNQVKTVAFDKTGTLTRGEFAVVNVAPVSLSKSALIKLAATAEVASPHPIAKSIVAMAGLNTDKQSAAEELVGLGVKATQGGQPLYVGNAKLMRQVGVTVDLPGSTTGTMVYVALGGQYQGAIEVADAIKENTVPALRALKQDGVTHTVMLTGDNHQVGQAVGQQIGIDAVKAELLPQDKVAEMGALKAQLGPKEKLAFVGDGLNDTPVLASADVGIAMGALGSDAAIESADVVLMNDDPLAIPRTIAIAKRTKQIVWENIVFALGIKLLFLTLAAFGITTMWWAVFSDVGVTLIAVLNTLRLLLIGRQEKPQKVQKTLAKVSG